MGILVRIRITMIETHKRAAMAIHELQGTIDKKGQHLPRVDIISYSTTTLGNNKQRASLDYDTTAHFSLIWVN